VTVEKMRTYSVSYNNGRHEFIQCSNYMKARVCRAPHLFSLSHRAHAVAENLGTEGPTLYFSVIRLLAVLVEKYEDAWVTGFQQTFRQL